MNISKLREPVNGLTHFYAAIAALIGTIFLLFLSWGDTYKMISLLIYGISMILLFSASATYHMVNDGPRVTQVLRKFDHSAIYLLIAGTYTPICCNTLTGIWQWGMLAVIWGLALIGIGIKIFYMKTPRWITAGIYVLMGWLSVFAINEMRLRLPLAGVIWLIVGGVLYTVGALIYSTKKLNFFPGKFGFHEIFHIFVILGALAHYIMIAAYIAPA